VSPAFTVRPVRPSDVPAVAAMVHELAEYERAADECHITAEQLETALFAPHPALFGHVAMAADGEPIGMALWYLSFSTWEGSHGLYLEDLFVRAAARGTGAGAGLLAALAAICVQRGYRRLEWVMLDWNPAAGFYATIGADVVDGWVPHRLAGAALQRLAERASRPRP